MEIPLPPRVYLFINRNDEKTYKADTVGLNADKVELIYVVDLFLMYSFCKRPACLIAFENYDTPFRPGVLQHLDEVPT